MQLETALSIIISVVAVAISYGTMKTNVSRLQEEIRELKSSRDKLGERMGNLEIRQAVEESHSKPYRIALPGESKK
jgi:hypothetical protein